MAKINYKGQTGKFDIIDVEKDVLKEWIKILDEVVASDKMRIFHMDLKDDAEIMNLEVEEKKEDLPY